MLASFIIPAYNASDTIARCLDSIYGLPVEESDFEVIVIDDCSTDNTIELVKEYACGHSNLILLCQPENHRQGAARNRGIGVAKGDYIYFCDADDEVTNEIVDALQLAKGHELDICYCDVLVQKQQGEFRPMRFNIPSPLITSGYDIGEKYTDEICTGPWPYIWKAGFLKKVNYPFVNDLRYEDADFIDFNMVQAERVGHWDLLIYKYYYNPNSTVNSCKYDTVADYALCAYRRLRFNETIKESNPLFVSRRNYQCLCWITTAFSFRRLTRIYWKDIPRFYERVGSEALKYMGTLDGLSKFNKFSIKLPNLAKLFLMCVQPVASLCRNIYKQIVH